MFCFFKDLIPEKNQTAFESVGNIFFVWLPTLAIGIILVKRDVETLRLSFITTKIANL
jgi:hypothetical protein